MVLAYRNENYENTSQRGDEDKPNADIRNLYNIDEDKPTAALGNLYSIDETDREVDAANNNQTNGVPNMKKPRGSP
jgi:hypothetical protein